MKEKIKNSQKSSFKIEEEISKKIYKKIKEKVSGFGLDEMIFKEIDNSMSFSEDWQKHYTKERIKDKIKKEMGPVSWQTRLLNYILDIIGIYIFFFIFALLLFIIGLHFIIDNTNEFF